MSLFIVGFFVGMATVKLAPQPFLRLLAALRLVRLVWLQDRWGQWYLSILRRDVAGQLWCHVYPASRIGRVILLPDGVTAGESIYIKSWKSYEKHLGPKKSRFMIVGRPEENEKP